MYQTFSILFYLQRNKASSDGKAPIYLRITVNGKRSEMSVHRKIEPFRWNSPAGKVRGNTAISRELNHYIETIRYKIYN